MINQFTNTLSSIPDHRADVPDADADCVLRHPATEPQHGVFLDEAGRGPGEDAAERLRVPRLRRGRADDARQLPRARATPLRGPHPPALGRQPQPRGHHARPREGHPTPLSFYAPGILSPIPFKLSPLSPPSLSSFLD